MKKKVVVIALLCVLLCGCSKNVSKLKDGSEAVVTFDNKKLNISANDLYTKLKERYGASELVDMVDTKILEDKYKNKMDDAKADAEKNFETVKSNFKDSNGNYDEASLKSALQQYYGYDDIDKFKTALQLNYLRNQATTDYAKSKVTDSEINKYYKDEIVGDRKISHIEIIPDVTESMSDDDKKAKEDEALKTAKEVITKLKKGEKFSDLAKEYSDDEDTKDKGGDLGYINKGDYGSDEFDDAAWKLEVGKYSTTPVKTSKGYEIIYVEKEKEKAKLDKVKNKIISTLADEKVKSDTTLQLKALESVRKDYGLNIPDDELKSSFNKYLDELMTNATSSANTSTSN